MVVEVVTDEDFDHTFATHIESLNRHSTEEPSDAFFDNHEPDHEK